MLSLSPVRWRRLILLGMAIVLGAVLFYSAQSALLPFIVGSFLVYLFLPVVNFLDPRMPRLLREWRLSRPLSILLTYLLVILLLVGFFAIFVPLISDQISQLIEASGQYTLQLLRITKGWNRTLIDEWFNRYYNLIPDWIRETLDANIQQITASLTNAFQNIVSWLGRGLQLALKGTIDVVTFTVSLVIGIIIVPFWMFYVLNDEKKIMQAFYSAVPERYRADVQNLQEIIGGVLSAYIRGQLILCLFIAAMSTLGLLILGVHFPLVLGTVAGILEVVPTIGPFLGAVPAVLVALLESPALALKTALLFVIIQQIENAFLVPKVQGASVKLHPTVIMLVVVIGSEIAGVWGVILAVPLSAIFRNVFYYLYWRSSDPEIKPEEAMARMRLLERGRGVVGPPLPWRQSLVRWGRQVYSRGGEVVVRLHRFWQSLIRRAKTMRAGYDEPTESE